MNLTDAFLRDYPEQEVEQEVARLEGLKEELALVRRLKALRGGLGHEPQPQGVSSQDPVDRGGKSPPATRRQMIETVMGQAPDRTMKLSHLRDALVQRDWLGTTEDEYHRLQVTASRMVKRNQLERPETGVYRLPTVPGDRSEEP